MMKKSRKYIPDMWFVVKCMVIAFIILQFLQFIGMKVTDFRTWIIFTIIAFIVVFILSLKITKFKLDIEIDLN
jgi:hypothetical protein